MAVFGCQDSPNWISRKICDSEIFCNFHTVYVQGDPNRNFLFQMALFLKWYIFEPWLVKPKWVWEVAVFCVKIKFFEKFKNNYKFHQNIEMLAPGFVPGTSCMSDQTFTPRPWRKAQNECHFSCIYFKWLKKSVDTKKKLPPLKHIFALPT